MKGPWVWIGGALLVAVLAVSLGFVLMAAGRSEPLPTMQVDDLPMLGAAKAPHEIVLVTDYGCPACKRFHAEILPELLKRYVDKGDARLRVLAFPIRDGSTELAHAVTCLQQRPGTDVRALYDRIYGQDLVGLATPELARKLAPDGAAAAELSACMQRPDIAQQVERQRYRAIVHGISSVPTVVIDRSLLSDPWVLGHYQTALRAAPTGAR
ncbi:thioredoxin domain-containing protein [Pseudomonas sp. CGJS7]|uniref:thioredoxin domain-containing protein n=1 Tax=Pseudomonas sp. CGJS7 TaxID=3109348 RepID=UPI00300BD14F